MEMDDIIAAYNALLLFGEAMRSEVDAIRENVKKLEDETRKWMRQDQKA